MHLLILRYRQIQCQVVPKLLVRFRKSEIRLVHAILFNSTVVNGVTGDYMKNKERQEKAK